MAKSVDDLTVPKKWLSKSFAKVPEIEVSLLIDKQKSLKNPLFQIFLQLNIWSRDQQSARKSYMYKTYIQIYIDI